MRRKVDFRSVVGWAFGLVLVVGLMAALAVISSCQTIGQAIVEKPKVALDHVGLKDMTMEGATILFGVKVENPNSFALKVDSLRYAVEVGGKPFGSGQIEKPTEVAGHGKAVVEIPIPVKYADVFASLIDFVQNKSSTYRVKGEATFGVLNIPFDEKGELKFH